MITQFPKKAYTRHSRRSKESGSLSEPNRGELKGYYNAVPTVKLGILTDGIIYQLFSDTEEENLMDNEPFAVVDLAQVA